MGFYLGTPALHPFVDQFQLEIDEMAHSANLNSYIDILYTISIATNFYMPSDAHYKSSLPDDICDI